MITLYTISGIILSAAFHFLYISQRIPFVFVNILFFLLAPLSYFYRSKASYLFMAASWIIVMPVAVYIYKADAAYAAASLAAFNILQAGFIQCRKIMNRSKEALESDFKSVVLKKKSLQSELGRVSAFESGMKEKELAMVSLYEVTRKMSASLKFQDIFDVFSSFLKESFKFRKSDLLILSREGAVPHVDRIYGVWQAGGEMSRNDSANYDNLIKLFAVKEPKDFYASRDSEPHIFDSLGMADRAVETLTAVPLLSEGELAAILLIENLPREDLEKFIILAMQFALEIKKVMLYEIVERLAITDSLTGLYVRRYFFSRLDEELNRSKSYKFKFAFLMFDIDDFKKCNDTYGHLVGDVVLKEMARIIKDSVREIDLVARYGGEEFAVLLPETDPDGAYLVAERIRERIKSHVFRAYDEEPKLTVSAGVSSYPKDTTNTAGLIERADKALYEAKRSGKNIVSVFKK